MNKKFYITTPIYYVNAAPHIGSLYSTLISDVISRTMKVFKKDVVFCTGTDEHGQKIYDAAKNDNKNPQEFVDSLIPSFKNTWQEWNIQYDIFIRTTDKNHIKAVQKWILDLKKNGFIYKSNYEGWYSVSSESFIAEKDIEKKDEEGAPICPISGKKAIWVSQEAYFFKLSKFQNELLKFYEENPNFITPSERLAEVISFVKNGLDDLCISRLKKNLSWGIPFPEDDNHVIYVWADALNNYITAIGYNNEERNLEFENTWPCDLHILGKDIVKFHAIFWPAFLMASNLKLPKRELVHGWILVDNKKMSKSLGNIIDPKELLSKYGKDVSRFYLMKYMAVTQDSMFSYEDLEEKNNSDLADSFGNLIQRVLVLSKKNNLNIAEIKNPLEEEELILYNNFVDMIKEFEMELNNYMIHRMYQAIWKFINLINAYFHKSEPWKIKDKEKFEKIIAVSLNAIFGVSVLLWPLMPESIEKAIKMIGVIRINNNFPINIDELKNGWNKKFQLNSNIEPIFKKIDIKKPEIEDKNIKKETKEINEVSFDQFSKIEIRVGQIIEIEDIKNSDKLYKFVVDFGQFGKREIAAGVKSYYKKEEIINKKTIFAFNLEPKSLCGIKSHGMTMMTKNINEKPIFVEINKDIENGIKLS
jgi:methionyl-tRNA synthetase